MFSRKEGRNERRRPPSPRGGRWERKGALFPSCVCYEKKEGRPKCHLLFSRREK